MRCVLLWVCGLLACIPAQADDRQERARIARERDEATLRFQQRQRECEQRFAVTACVDEARAEHRQALLRLRGQESDEAERKQRAAQRMAAIREKVSAEAARDASPRPVRPAPAMQVREPRRARRRSAARPGGARRAGPGGAQRERAPARSQGTSGRGRQAAGRAGETWKVGRGAVA
ncbi:hypothetical protein [Piscinibacter sp.]|uniref:hypothetical protein n=1 Tax=Piscinibacter sp. TaxID=1903157 RepID=UPI001DB14354|nr:hypothetical protein [Piscinibacter sp.]MBK7530108.1 hypothetical protein [Piscinibacter sp.]